MFSLRKGDNMQAFLLLFLLSEILLLRLTSATTMTEPRQNTRVRISAFEDTIVFKFIRPHVDARLEGYILGYGSSMFSKQFIQLPADGQPYETELDAEPKYLVAVQSNKPEEPKKQCAGKVDLEKPLNLVIGSVTESSVLLSWGTLLASPLMDSVVEDCFDEGHFTVRYREKEPSNTWHYQTCPSTSTVIDNLKPDALYEFGVRADTDNNSGAWNAADQIIEPRELNQAKPKKPVLAGQQLFVPPVPVLTNIALTRTTPLFEHTDPPEPCKTSASTATESPTTSDNPHASTEPLPSTHTSIMSTPKTTSTVQPENPTSHTSTTQTDPLTEQHTSITPQQTTMTQPQLSTTQKLTLTTTQTQTTTQEYTLKTQITVKDQPYTAKQQFSKTTSSPSPPTTKPQGTTSTVQEHPHPPKEKNTIAQDTRKNHPNTRKHRLSTTQHLRGTSRHQTTHTNHFPQTTPHYQTRTITHSEQPNTQPSSTTMNWSTSGYSPTNTALTYPTSSANIQDDPVTWRTTDVSKLPVFSTIPFIHEEYSTSHISTTEGQPLTAIVQKLTPHTVYPPISTWYQHQPSTTSQHSSTMKQQASTTKYNRKPHSQVENQPVYHEEQLPGTQKTQLNLSPKTTFTKSDAIQNSPVTERVTMRTSQPGQPMASSPPKDDRVLSPPTLTNEVASMNEGRGIFRPLAQNGTQRVRPYGRVSQIPPFPPVNRNSTFNRKRVPHGEGYRGIWGSKPQKPRKHNGKTKLNQVSETKEKEKVIDLKQMDPLPDFKPLVPPTTEKPANPESVKTTTPQSVFEGSRFDTGDNSSVFSPHPLSELDAAGKNRFVGPHVIYRTDKRPEEPCSVTKSLSFFPDEEVGYLNVTGPPKTPPSNLTVVTVEGCPSFVILDWDKTDNETTEYEVVSSTKGPDGEEVSIQTTNQTHTAVENLKPESSYEFKVTPKNELGSGPTSEPVNFCTESADPRVSETPTGKNAIWSSFPFRADSYTECTGRQFIKRTWYRKFVGIQLCNSLRYKIYLSDSLKGKFYSIGDQTGYGEDHCQFVDSFLDGQTGGPLPPNQLPVRQGYFRAMRQEPVKFGEIGGNSMINYVAWYECGVPIPGKW